MLLFSRNSTLHGLIFIGPLLAASGCGVAGPESEPVASLQSELRNGTVVSPWLAGAPDESRAVVLLRGCTATIIDPEWILSAKHCRLTVGDSVTSVRPTGDVSRKLDRVAEHSSIDAVLAHVDVPFKDIPRVNLYPGTTSAIVGSSVNCYGYGAKGLGSRCTTSADCTAGQWCQGGWCLTPSAELRSGVLPTTADADGNYFDTVRNAADQMTLPGDSGGPCFIAGTAAGINSAWYLDASSGIAVSVPQIRSWAHQIMAHRAVLEESSFSDANGWNAGAQYYSTIAFPDVNGDGRADICGRGGYGINCALSTGTGFSAARLWHTEFSDANGWNFGPEYYATIAYPDLNGDGKSDVCGRASTGVFCALSSGSSFGTGSIWQAEFKDTNGWNFGPQYYSTIMFPDVNGDGRADVCGRASSGVICALSTGSAFGPWTLWEPSFSDANGWNSGAQYYGTLRFEDINGDGRADLCGRGHAGVLCALSTGSSFARLSVWDTSFSDANGWNRGAEYYSTISFPDLNGDGRHDVCGRGIGGVTCALSSGTAFTGARIWTTSFQDADGGNRTEYYRTLSFPDLDYDGKADFCGRGIAGVYCSFSTGRSFEGERLSASDFSDANGWNGAPYYSTLRFADIDGRGRKVLCARGNAGISCAP